MAEVLEADGLGFISDGNSRCSSRAAFPSIGATRITIFIFVNFENS
jgi:hypothetical protein